MKKASGLILMILLFVFVCPGQTISKGGRAKYNFNSDWKLLVGDTSGAEAASFGDSSWKPVTLPHAWNEDDAFRKDIKDLSTGIAWYRKHFRLPSGTTNKKIFLEFEGIRQAGEFYLNGKFIGRSENGVMAFGFDISNLVTAGENVLAARIDNSWDYREKATGERFQWNDRNFYANYGGINKNVYLHICDKLYQTLPLYSDLKTTGVYVYAKDFDIKNKTATVTAETEVKNEYSTSKTFAYTVVIKDPAGKTISAIKGDSYTLAPGETRIISASAPIKNLNFWSWGYGYLYDVYTTLKIGEKEIDTVKTRTGFRKTEFANGVFKLNDRTLQIKGYAQRTTNEWPALGSAVPAWMSDFSNRLMVDGNANLVRWMHVTPWKQDVESCDRAGLMESMPAGDSEGDVNGHRWQQRVELMRDAIIYNRNNPSIVFFESGNKGISEAHMQDMKSVRDKYDPYGGRAIGSREMLDSKIAEYGGEMLYIDKSTTKPLWEMEYSRDEALRKYWDEFSPPFHKDGDGPLYNGQDASVYNRNQDSFAIEDVTRWFDYWEARPGTGRRISAGGVNIIFSDSNTHHRGAENYRRSGEVDALRIPKDGYFADQIMWDGWVDVEKPRTHIIGHWNYEKGAIKDVYVVSSAEKVELFVNGVSKGFGEQSNRFLFTFKNTKWESGEIKAVGYDTNNKKITEDSEKTAGAPVGIRLTAHERPDGFIANGADITIVDIEVVDKNGNRCPTALNQIDLKLTGEGEWRGGIAQGPDNYILSKTLPVEGGVNRVLIRSTTKAGKIVLEAISAGLKPATMRLNSRPYYSTNGLSSEFPSDNLSANLTRGPTPRGESFKLARKAIPVTNVSAGSNAVEAKNSIDDNETTSWTSDGKSGTAWIEYDLNRESKIDQIVLKMVGWRTQSYPIRVLVNDKVVFSGLTQRSLGYITLNIAPTAGKSVRIELTGNATNRDAFGNIVEIPGTPDAQSSAGKAGGKNTLGIVEAEFYTSDIK